MGRRPLKYSLVLAAALAGATAVPAQAADSFSCRASTARVNLLGLTLEPFVANRPDAPCADGSASLIAPTTIGPVSAAVINATTDADPGGAPGANADVQAAGARIAVAGLPVITADVLHTTASARCVNGSPAFSDSSVVANVRIGGIAVNVPGGNAIVTRSILGLATLYINERVVTGSRVTRRALRLTTLVGTQVVVAESTANREGNPCAAAPPTECNDGVDNGDPEDSLADAADGGCHTDGNPNNQGSYDPNDPSETNAQCSDGVDNGDPEDTLADAADPGCHTDGVPGNPATYDPGDNDEANGPRPQCSDGFDNDTDGVSDIADPGCHSDGNPNNDGSYDPNDDNEQNPACNDAVDNDGDGRNNFPSDPGCSSLGDDDESNFIKKEECNDGIDNDGINGKDYPEDPGCTDAYDTTEGVH